MADLIKRYSGATDGTGPSPIVWNKIPLAEILMNPASGHGFFQRFINAGPTHATTGTTIGGWICNHITNAGTIAAANIEGGGIVLTTAATENDGMQMQTGEAFVADKDSRIVFGCRVAIGDADAADMFVGLTTLDTDIAQTNPNDCIGFTVADGSVNINYKVDTTGTASVVDSGADAADGAYVNLEFYVDRESSVEFYVDGVLKGKTSAGIPVDEPLGAALAMVSGSAGAKTLSVAWVYAYQWRIAR